MDRTRWLALEAFSSSVARSDGTLGERSVPSGGPDPIDRSPRVQPADVVTAGGAAAATAAAH
jgi:hypothetical protein